MNFRRKYDEHQVFYSEVGESIQPEYSLRVDDDGKEELYQSGETDLQEFIQSHYESVSMDNILARYMNGDPSVLQKVKGFFADVSEMPVTLSDVLNIQKRGKELFDKLPIEYRNAVGNSYERFLSNPKAVLDLIAKAGVEESKASVEKSTDVEEVVEKGDE